ncbi:MAG: DUF2752 domain-containing protein [Bacteroidetes bacterium]|nr:DUF2752 domain-containing protein [Bacteroidota bacterium]
MYFLYKKIQRVIRSVYKTLRSLFLTWAEVFVWLTALLLLAFVPPTETQQTFCVWHHAGLEACPGCGMGHSIAELFKGHLAESFNRHPLGMFAVLVIVWRIIRLSWFNIKAIRTLKPKSYVENL